MTDTQTIPIVHSEFGLGPYGKAVSIAESAPSWAEPVVLKASDWRRAESIAGRQLCIVVGEPDACANLSKLGLTCVFVDSLPFLWVEGDPMAVDAAVYCAQVSGEKTRVAGGPLEAVNNLVWIPPIVNRSASITYAPRPGQCAIHLGGVASPIEGWHGYIDLVLPQICVAAVDAGMTDVRFFCSPKATDYIQRVHADRLHEMGERGANAAVGFASKQELLDYCATSGHILTSPGLTFILECSSAGLPITLLPPQNLSQIVNKQRFERVCASATALRWPDPLGDAIDVLTHDPGSESERVTRLYQSIIRASKDQSICVALHESIFQALSRRSDSIPVSNFCEAYGNDGAQAVWAHTQSLRPEILQ